MLDLIECEKVFLVIDNGLSFELFIFVARLVSRLEHAILGLS